MDDSTDTDTTHSPEKARALQTDPPLMASIMNIHNDDQRRRWYFDAEADDQRVHDALSAVEQK